MEVELRECWTMGPRSLLPVERSIEGKAYPLGEDLEGDHPGGIRETDLLSILLFQKPNRS